jgi:hypothetical protein
MPELDENGEPIVDASKLRGLTDRAFQAPDLAQAVEGWRAWATDLEPPPYGVTPKLHSATWDYVWTPRVKARAHCGKGCEDSEFGLPGETCSCGFYSAKTLEHLRSMGYSRYNENSGTITVVGQLACWGKVIEGSQGWRSEFAYPVKLYVPYEAHRLAKPLREGYGVPVKMLNLLDPASMPTD